MLAGLFNQAACGDGADLDAEVLELTRVVRMVESSSAPGALEEVPVDAEWVVALGDSCERLIWRLEREGRCVGRYVADGQALFKKASELSRTAASAYLLAASAGAVAMRDTGAEICLRARRKLLRYCESGAVRGDSLAMAIEMYSKAALGGDVEAVRIVGRFFERGTGVERDRSMARFMFQKAADGGDAHAMRLLGEMCEEDGDTFRAIEFYKRAAGQGDGRATKGLAVLLFRMGVGVNVGLAVFKQLADGGDFDIAFRLGAIHFGEDSSGMLAQLRDFEKGVVFFEQASRGGQTGAMNSLARYFGPGGMAGAARNDDMAVRFYQRAVDHGDLSCALELASLYENGLFGSETGKDWAKALQIIVFVVCFGQSVYQKDALAALQRVVVTHCFDL